MVYYYKKKIPSIDDVVVAKVLEISPYGVNVSLNEFNDIKGFIHCSDVSRKKKVNMNKLLKIGKDVLLIVININEKGYIDLSKRSINDEEIKIFNEKNKLYHQIYNIFKHIFIKINNLDKIFIHIQNELKDNKIEKIRLEEIREEVKEEEVKEEEKVKEDDYEKVNVINNSDKNKDFQKLINDDELYNFMCYTLWEIQEHFENQEILNKLLSKNANKEILELINYESINNNIDNIKEIIDNYIDTKLDRVKPTVHDTFKLISYGLTGLSDIKYALDYETFPEINTLLNDYEIKISYIASSQYSIELYQKDYFVSSGYHINDALRLIKEQIIIRAKEKNIQNQITL